MRNARAFVLNSRERSLSRAFGGRHLALVSATFPAARRHVGICRTSECRQEKHPAEVQSDKNRNKTPHCYENCNAAFVLTPRRPSAGDRLSSVATNDLLRFNGAVERDPSIDAWLNQHPGELGSIARHWFEIMRTCGDEVRELMHDGCPVACFGDAPFAYVNVFTAHVNVGFFQGASLPDPARLLQGNGKFMRHVKLKPGTPANTAALSRLIETAYWNMKARVENG
jgi:hypothetical protein